MKSNIASLAALTGVILGAGGTAALADDATPANGTIILAQAAPAATPAAPAAPGATPPPTPAAGAAPAAPAAPAAVSLLFPAMSSTLSLNSTPYSFNAGPLGKIYVTGIGSGLGIAQDNTVPGDKDVRADISNAQVIIQKVDGMFQFVVDVGAYSFPVLGASYAPASASNTFHNFFSVVPVAFAKFAPTDTFSIEGGKLPTLIGAEGIFTYQNMNIERGLLWNLEPVVQEGAQVNYTLGPVALAAQYTDGYYSDRYNWLSASAAWTINPTNTLSVVAGGNLGHTNYSKEFATSLPLNNGEVYNVIYTYSSAPWTITPYVQATHTGKNAQLGYLQEAWTYGGAVLASYTFTPGFSLAGRFEYVGTTGSTADGAPNVLGYGAGSKAVSFTVTPTFTFDRFYVRPEASYVRAASIIPGSGFSSAYDRRDQVRGLLELGVIF